MSAHILDGKILAQKLTAELNSEVAALQKKYGLVPSIVSILIGNDPSAVSYTNSQKRTADKVGIKYDLVALDAKISQADLIKYLHGLNRDANVHCVMLQKPVPPQIDYQKAINELLPEKDVEGMNATNLGRLLLGSSSVLPCTPSAVMAHLRSIPDFSLIGKEVVVIGRSEIVGKPAALLLLAEHATVTICHSGTSKAGLLEKHVAAADVVVAAIGKPEFVRGEWLKAGAVVIDVGINSVGEKLVGDVHFDSAVKKASFITPVPGGVGPVTAVMLMRNAVEAFKLQVK